MYGHLKGDVADAVIALLEPVQTRFHQIRQDQTLMNQVLKQGATQARARAAVTLEKVYDAVGFVLPT
jgi:tryptophanyl-tRNA synthetase